MAPSAVVVWGEDPGGPGSVYARQLTGTTAGAALDAKLPSLSGAPAAATDLIMPDVDVDGAGTAWVVFRQSFTYGATAIARALARPLPPGGSLGTAQVVDGLASPPTENVEYPRVDVNTAGQGLTANYLGTTVGVQSAALAGGTWTRGSLVNPTPNTGTAFASAAIAENGSGLVSWIHDPDGAGTQVRRVVARTTLGGFGPLLTLSNPALGDLQQAQLTSAAGTNFAIVGYAQGGAGATDPRRIGGAVVDLPGPGGGGGPRSRHRQAQAHPAEPVRQALPDRSQAARARPPCAPASTIRYRLSEAARRDALVRAGAPRPQGRQALRQAQAREPAAQALHALRRGAAGPRVRRPGGRAAADPLRGPPHRGASR